MPPPVCVCLSCVCLSLSLSLCLSSSLLSVFVSVPVSRCPCLSLFSLSLHPQDLRQELGRLRSNNNNGSESGGGATTTRTPPEMALRRQLSSLSDATLCAGGPNANEDTATVIDGDELLLSVEARLEAGAGLDDGSGIADELIKARYKTC